MFKTVQSTVPNHKLHTDQQIHTNVHIYYDTLMYTHTNTDRESFLAINMIFFTSKPNIFMLIATIQT